MDDITIHQLLFSDVPNDGFSSDDPDINDAEDGDLESEHTLMRTQTLTIVSF